jgi:biopolymer transport protein TolQ
MDHSFSLVSLFVGSDFITMLDSYIMLMASIWSWAIILEKFFAFKTLKASNDIFEKKFWSGGSLDELHANLDRLPCSPKSSVFAAAMRECKKTSAMLAGKKVSEIKVLN